MYISEYPIPNFYANNVSAYLWLINIPEYEHMDSIVYPENEFVTGCIYEVSHNNIPIAMVPFGMGISDKCVKQCHNNTCNGGKCLETFESKPLCDCFTTYRNGDFCNSSESSWMPYDLMNISNGNSAHITTDMVNDGFQFEVLKICWKSYLNDILLITNRLVFGY